MSQPFIGVRGNDLSYKSVLIRAYTVINLESVLKTLSSTTESVNVDMSNVNLRHTNENISDSTTKTFITESKLCQMLNVTTVQNISNADEKMLTNNSQWMPLVQ